MLGCLWCVNTSSIGERNLTQILNEGDPIGFAESILAKKNLLRYRRFTDLKLIKIDGPLLRQEVNNSHIVVKSIIKYLYKNYQYFHTYRFTNKKPRTIQFSI